MQSLIIGAGYVAEHLYKQLKKNTPDNFVYTVSRSVYFLDNNTHIKLDLDEHIDSQKFSSVFNTPLNLYYLVPPKPEGFNDSRVTNFISYLKKINLYDIKIIYISTSGVYGNRNGDWVTEKTTIKPETPRAKRRYSAEQQFLHLSEQAENIKIIILRTPGIYGPNRLPVTKIKNNNKIINENECGYTNLIHVNDLATACIAASLHGKNREIYNISDGVPVKSSYYYKLVAKLAKLNSPEEVSYQEAIKTFDSKRLSFLQESRRLDISKMQTELNVHLSFSSLEKGILKSLK